MKVLLISHPRLYAQRPDFPPIGTAYLGAAADNAGYEIALIDGGLWGIPQIIKQAKSFSPEVIGVTCWTIQRETVWKLCAALQQELPKAFLIMGGPHATIFPEHIFKKTQASIVVIGEGEATFRELLDVFANRRDLKNVKGIALRNPDNTVYYTEPRTPIENLDTISRPFYTGFDCFAFSNYSGFPSLPRPTAPIISSRGCVFNCTFCGSVAYWGKRWRYRSADNVLEEIEWLIKDMRANSLFFFDDNLPVNKKRIFAICEGMIQKRLRFPWACCSHVKMIDKDLLKLMKESGCVSIDFGVESGSEKILHNINKKQTRQDIEKAFALTHEIGIKPRAYLMVGNPGEDETTIDETIDMIGRIVPDRSIGAAILWLLPGTVVYNEAVKNGHINNDFWLYSDNIPYNLQEYSYEELCQLRKRLMLGIAKKKGGFMPLVNYYLKNIYYKYPFLSCLTSLIPDKLR